MVGNCPDRYLPLRLRIPTKPSRPDGFALIYLSIYLLEVYLQCESAFLPPVPPSLPVSLSLSVSFSQCRFSIFYFRINMHENAFDDGIGILIFPFMRTSGENVGRVGGS